MHGARRMHRAVAGKRAFDFGNNPLFPGTSNNDQGSSGDPLDSIINGILNPFGQSTTQSSLSSSSTLSSSSVPPTTTSSSSVTPTTTSSSSSSESTTSTFSSSSITSTATESSTPPASTTIVFVSATPTDTDVAAPVAPKSFLENTPLSASVFTLIGIFAIVAALVIAQMVARARRKAKQEMEIQAALSSMMVADHFSDDGSHDSKDMHQREPSFGSHFSSGTGFTAATAGRAGYGAFGRNRVEMPDVPMPIHSSHYAEVGPLMSQQAFAAAPFNPTFLPEPVAAYNPSSQPPMLSVDTTLVSAANNNSLIPPAPPSPAGSSSTLGVPGQLVRRGSLLDNEAETSGSVTPTYFLNPTSSTNIPKASLPEKFGNDDADTKSIFANPYDGLEYEEIPEPAPSRSLKVANQ